MDTKALIFSKLEAFIKKFYANELLRGTLFFIGLGLLYFIITGFVEHFLWLSTTGRTLLFWSFLMVELFLLVRFILFPISRLFKFQKGLTYQDASHIIGKHFNSVNDKLINFLQLTQDSHQSELLLASIEQKANDLKPVPFTAAIDFSQNKKFLPLAIFPIVILILLVLSGRQYYITDSMNRVVHYEEQFTPPAPFSFVISSGLMTEQGKSFTLKAHTNGAVVPEKMSIDFGEEQYLLQKVGPGQFEYTFEQPNETVSFVLKANDVVSPNYTLKVTSVPAIEDFTMKVVYPKYLNKHNEVIKGTGNAILPEGTVVSWELKTIATDEVTWNDAKNRFSFLKSSNVFALTKKVLQSTDYQIISSNSSVKGYEKLQYSISVVKDQYPTLSVSQVPDSLKTNNTFLLGQVSDDYGLSRLVIAYYEQGKPQTVKFGAIPVNHSVYDRFVFSFPANLSLKEGISYEYYFEVFDNDGIHGPKGTKSSLFTYREATSLEKKEQLLQLQNENISSLSKTLQAQDKQNAELEKLKKTNKENSDFNYKEQQKVTDFIKRQQEQEKLMQNYSEKIKENLDKFEPKDSDPKKEELQKRLDDVSKESEKNKKLLDELKQLNQKLEQEELFEKIEKFQQKSKNQTKNLEQLVELTKRYYVEKKAQQLSDKLEQLSEKQQKLSENKSDNNAKEQQALQQEFDKLKNDLRELEMENKSLKSPLDIPSDKEKEDSIDKDMNGATEDLKKGNTTKASPKQQSAAKKMSQMANAMKAQMESGEKEQMDEDIKMLRQIMDNLLEFSFSQEKLMQKFKSIKAGATFAKDIKTQQDLKYQFKHVDDSLFAMSLRNPKIGETVTKEIGNVYYNLDKSIDNFTSNNLGRGLVNQQYTFTSANNLANLLADILNNMQMSMSGMGQGKPKPGKGQGSGMQLPDIIKKQEELGKKMGQGKPGQQGKSGQKPGEGQQGSSGDKPGEGQDGKSGQGNGSKSGQGTGNKSGENGSDGEGDAQQILSILKQQQQLREALEQELKKQGLGGQGQNALEQMKQIEKQLMNKGFSQQLVQKALNLKYELLKLEKAAQEQNQDNKRESNTSQKDFQNSTPPLPQNLQDYLHSIEILNRQSVPLRSQFNKRVQEYFKNHDTL